MAFIYDLSQFGPHSGLWADRLVKDLGGNK
jgi:hypothetical protein